MITAFTHCNAFSVVFSLGSSDTNGLLYLQTLLSNYFFFFSHSMKLASVFYEHRSEGKPKTGSTFRS